MSISQRRKALVVTSQAAPQVRMAGAAGKDEVGVPPASRLSMWLLDGSFLQADWFNLAMGFIVVCNAIEIGVQTDDSQKDRDIYIILDNGFLIAYLVELTLRLYFTTWSFFAVKFNIFDLVLVFMAVLDTWFLSNSGLRSFTVLRVLRMMRLARLFKLLRFSKELWLIVTMLRSSLKTLMWVSILLVSFLWINAIFATIVLGESEAWLFVKRATAGPYEFFDVSEYFGKVWRSFFSLFQLCTLDKAMTSIIRPVSAVYEATMVYFIFIIFSCSLGLLNVMTAIVARNAFLTAKDNETARKEKLQAERKQNILLLTQIIKNMDVDRDGHTSSRELKLILQSGNITTSEGGTLFQILNGLSLSPDDLLTLFRMVDKEETGQVITDDFIKAIVKFRGESKAQDIIKLIVQVQSLGFKCTHLDQRLDTTLSQLGSLQHTYQTAIFDGIKNARLPGLVPTNKSGSIPTSNGQTETGRQGVAQEVAKNSRRPTFALPNSIDFARIERTRNLPPSSRPSRPRREDRDSGSSGSDTN